MSSLYESEKVYIEALPTGETRCLLWNEIPKNPRGVISEVTDPSNLQACLDNLGVFRDIARCANTTPIINIEGAKIDTKKSYSEYTNNEGRKIPIPNVITLQVDGKRKEFKPVMNRHLFGRNTYDILGEGTFGLVMKYESKHSDAAIALKIARRIPLKNSKEINESKAQEKARMISILRTKRRKEEDAAFAEEDAKAAIRYAEANRVAEQKIAERKLAREQERIRAEAKIEYNRARRNARKEEAERAIREHKQQLEREKYYDDMDVDDSYVYKSNNVSMFKFLDNPRHESLYRNDRDVTVINILKGLGTDCNVIPVKYLGSKDQNQYVVMPALTGSLDDVLDGLIALDPLYRLQILFNLVNSIMCLNDNDLYYTDLKPGNILVRCMNGRIVLMLGDIGSISMESETDEMTLTFMPPTFSWPSNGIMTLDLKKKAQMWGMICIMLILFGIDKKTLYWLRDKGHRALFNTDISLAKEYLQELKPVGNNKSNVFVGMIVDSYFERSATGTYKYSGFTMENFQELLRKMLRKERVNNDMMKLF